MQRIQRLETSPCDGCFFNGHFIRGLRCHNRLNSKASRTDRQTTPTQNTFAIKKNLRIHPTDNGFCCCTSVEETIPGSQVRVSRGVHYTKYYHTPWIFIDAARKTIDSQASISYITYKHPASLCNRCDIVVSINKRTSEQ